MFSQQNCILYKNKQNKQTNCWVRCVIPSLFKIWLVNVWNIQTHAIFLWINFDFLFYYMHFCIFINKFQKHTKKLSNLVTFSVGKEMYQLYIYNFEYNLILQNNCFLKNDHRNRDNNTNITQWKYNYFTIRFFYLSFFQLSIVYT